LEEDISGPATIAMTATHVVFLLLTIVLPFVLCGASRRLKSERFDCGVTRSIATLLLAAELSQLFFKAVAERGPLAAILPMHLCDWALLATAAALWWQAPRCFEVAYFWGLAGTIQGLLTPALDPALAAWRHAAFFVVHTGIVVGVLFLVFAKRMRPVPASLTRVLMWSEGYLCAALAVNTLTGQNYGFLAHPPLTPSLLDFFPKTQWLYVATINGVALVAFTLLYLPWWIIDLRRAKA
jgi:hypothetical integral membrane protein (TIGR02206 family)